MSYITATNQELIGQLTNRVRNILDRNLDLHDKLLTIKQGWEELRAICKQHRDEALIDDMEFFVQKNSIAMQAIDQHLKTL